MDRQEFSAIVLAGGRSARMGKSKAELRFGDKTMLDHIIEGMLTFSDDVIVAGASRRHDIRVIADEEEYRGPVTALQRTLREIRHVAAFVCSCDVPFVSADLARKLCEMLGDDDALVPNVDGKLQMLHAVYSKRSAAALAAMLAQNQHRLQDLVQFARVRIIEEEEVRVLDPTLRSFFNLNTPADYQRALDLMGPRSSG